MELKIGLVGTAEVSVNSNNTARTMGSGDLNVFATPAMIALMEKAATNAVKDCIPNDYSTVGTMINVKHIAATPEGMNVTAKASLIEIDGKRLLFSVSAYDEKEMIGEGHHERFVVNINRFSEKSSKKLL